MSNPKKEKKEMKKIMLSLGLMLGALTLTNCSNEIDENINANTDGVAFELTAAIDGDRTATDGFKTNWVAGDQINLFHTAAGTTTYVNDNAFKVDDAAAGHFVGTLKEELTAEAYDWYAFYPYSSDYTTPAGTRYYKLWQQTQTVAANSTAHVVGLNGPLYGVADNVAVGEPVKVQMHQLGSLLRVKVGNESGDDFVIQSINVASANTYITGSFYVGFNKDGVSRCEMSGASYAYKDVTLNIADEYTIADGDDAGDHCFYAAVAPFTAPESGETLTITIVTDKGTYETTKAIPAGAEFASGVINSLVITVEGVAEIIKEFPYTETFADNLGDFTIDDVAVGSLSTIWNYDSYGYMKGSGFKAGAATEGWLISPYVDLTGAAKPVLKFDHAGNFFGSQANMKNAVSVYVREADGEWAALTIPVYPNGTSWNFVNSDDIALSAYVGKTVQFGFKYTSPASGSIGTWEIKNVEICEAPFSMSATAPAEFANTAATGSFTITTKNADGYTITAALKDATQTWISNIAVASNTVTFDVAANTGNARSAAIVVTATNGTNTKTIEVAISQAAGASAAETTSLTIDLTKQGFENKQALTSVEAGDITVKFAGGGNSTVPKYYTSGTAVRMYPKNTFTVSAGELTMTKIVLTFPSGYTNELDIIANKGSYSSGTWTGSASEVQFQLDPTKTRGQSRLVKITITYIPGEDGPAVVLQDRGLKFSATTATATLGSTFTAPTLSGVTDGVTYTSSNAAVATVNATTGAVTLVGAGSTTIKATAAENATHKAGEASYTLTVNAAGEASYTLQFGSSYNSKGTSGYSGVSFNSTCNGFTWTIANANNNNNGWNYIKIGSKSAAYTGTITTSKAIPEAIKTVTMTVDACTTSYINSIKMYVASDSSFSQNVQTISVTPAMGNLVFTVPTPTENSFYKIEVACAQAESNGPIQISKVVYTTK